jgi:hypothetical protein
MVIWLKRGTRAVKIFPPGAVFLDHSSMNIETITPRLDIHQYDAPFDRFKSL